MTETDDHIAPEDEQKLVAAEYVLGVLDPTERRIAARQIERVPALAREVEDWEQRLGGLADGVAPVAPPPELWARIESNLAAPATVSAAATSRLGLWHSLTFWRSFAIGSAAMAAASMFMLTYIGLTPTAPRAPMLATLGQTSGQPGFVAAVSSDGRSLTIVPAALLTSDQQSMELWLIPAGDRPHSLGLIARGQPVRLTLPPELASRLTTDTTLAVSLEPLGGSPTGQPTGPVIANGKLTSL
jgi:anti-sigma-K factor RskA